MQQLLTQIKEDVINKITVLSAILFVLPYMLSLSRWFDMGWKNIYIFHTIIYLFVLGLAVYRKRFNYFQKTIAVTILYLLISFVGLYKFGLNGGYYFAIVAMAIVSTLTKRSFAIYTSLVILFVFSLIAIGYSTYSIDPAVDLNVFVRSPFHWLLTIVSIFSVILIFIYGFGDFYRNLTETIVENEKVNSNLLLVKSIIDKSPSLIYSADIEGRIIMANKEFQDLFSLQKSEIIGKLRQDFMPVEIAKQHRDNDLEVIRTKKAIIIEEENMEADGKHYYISQKFPLFDLNGEIYGVGGISTDISKEKRTAKDLKKSENKYKSLFENSADGIIVFNDQSEILELNSKICEILGYNREELIVLKGYEFIHSEDIVNKDHAAALAQLQQGKTILTQYRLRRKDGSYIHTELSVKKVSEGYFLNIIRDISERKLAEKLIEENEVKYRSFFENNMDAMLVTSNDGNIFSANPAACAMFGRTEVDIIKIGRAGLIDPSDTRLSHLISKREEKGKVKGTLTMLRKDGTRFEGELSSAVFENADKVKFTSLLIRDLTERIQAEKALQEREKLLSVIFNNHTDLQLLINITNEEEFMVEAINNPFNITASNFGITLDFDAVIGKSIHNLYKIMGLSAAYYDKSIATYNEVIKRGKSISFNETISISGHIYNSEITLSPILNENGVCQYVLYNSHNITEQTKATNTIKEREKILSVIFNNHNDLQLLVSLDNNGDFIVDTINKPYIDTALHYGIDLDLDAIIGKPVNVLNDFLGLGDDYYDITIAKYKEVATTGKTLNFNESIEVSGKTYTSEVTISSILNDAGKCQYILYNSHNITEQTIANIALKESEEKFKQIFLTSPDFVTITQIEDGSYLDVNDNFLHKSGYTRDEIIGKTARDIKIWNNIEDRDQMLSKLIEFGKVENMEAKFTLKNGSIIDGLLSAAHLKIDDKLHILTITRDITELKQAEKLLLESEEKFKQIFLTSPDFVSINQIEDGLYIDANENFIQKSGYTRKEIIGKTSIDLSIWHNPEDRNRMISLLHENGKVENMAAKFRMKNNKIIDGLYSASLLTINNAPHIISITRDITELKLAEKLTFETQSRLQSALSSTTDGVVITDSMGNFIDFNDSFATFHRFKGKTDCPINNEEYYNIMDAFSPEGELIPAEMWAIPRALRGETLTNSEIFLKRKDTGEEWVGSYSFSPIRDEEGLIVGSIVVGRDITEQKHAEQAFKETASNLRSMIDNRKDSIYSIDLDFNYIIFNTTFENIINNQYNIELKKGMSLVENLTEEETRFWVPKFESVFKGESVTFEFTFEMNNEIRYFQTTLNPIVEDHIITGASGISIDVTERKLVEDALKLSKEKFEKSFQLSPFLISLSTYEGQVIEVNDRIYETLGYTREEFIARNSIDNPLWVDINDRQKFIDLLKSDEYVSATEVQFYKKSGEIGVFSWSGCIIELEGIKTCLTIVYDITERKFVEEALIISEEKFEKSFRLSPYMVSLSSMDGRVIEVNDRVLDTLGYTRDEFIGNSTTDLQIWVNPKEREDFAAVLKRDDNIHEMEVQFRKKSGVINEYLLSASIIELNENKLFLSIIHDITERKNAENEIKSLNSELETKVKQRTSQLEAINKELTTFTYSVSHDLKAPLRGIDGYSKLLADLYKPELNQEAQIFIEKIRNSTSKMNQIIDDLLEYSRLERSQLKFSKLNFKELITSVLSIYTEEIEAGCFKIDNKINDIEIYADPKGIIIAFRNLIENAIKFTKGKSNPTIKIEIEEKELSWLISVNDNGIGFDMRYHDKIFDIFQRLQRVEDFPGTGIGLALVSKAMKRMQGKTWAESVPNIGSTFYLEIPKQQQ